MSDTCLTLKNFGIPTSEDDFVGNAEKELISWYENDKKSPMRNKAILAARLNLWRKYNQKGPDEFPKNKSSFTRFVNWRLGTAEEKFSPYNITEAQWKDIDDVNNGAIEGLGTPVLENRLRMIASQFTILLDDYQKKHKGYSRARCLSEFGGTDKLVKEIIRRISSLDEAGIVGWLALKFNNRKFDELTEEEKKEVARTKKVFASMQNHADSLSILARKYINEYETGIQVDIYTRESDPENSEEPITELKGKRYLDYRTIDVADTVTSRARNILGKLYMIDSNGKTVLDDLGYPVRVSSREALQTLVQYCWTSTPESFLTDLANISESYPWVKSLIYQLDTDVKKAAIYTAAKKAKMLYSYIILEKGTYLDKRLNTLSAHNGVLRTISLNWGSHILDKDMTLYDEAGGWADKSSEGRKFRTAKAKEKWKKLFGEPIPGWSDLIGMNVYGIDTSKSNPNWTPKLIPAISRQGDGVVEEVPEHYARPWRNRTGAAGIEAMQWYLNTFSEEAENLARAAHGFGFDITASDIRRAAMIPINKNDKKFFHSNYDNRYEAIASNIQALYTSLVSHLTIEKAFIAESPQMQDLMLAIGLSKYYDVDSKGMDGNKIRQTYITPNLLSELMVDLRNDRKDSPEVYVQKLKDKYLKYEGFTLDGQPTGILKYLIEHPDYAQQNIVLGDESSFNHVVYEDMRKQQVGTMEYILWRGSHYEHPKFLIPISADYGVCYYIQFPSVPSNGGKSIVLNRDSEGRPVKFNTEASIVKALADEVLIEYNRIKSTEDRIKNGGDNRAKLRNEEGDEKHRGKGLMFHIFPEMNDSGFREKIEAEPSNVEKLNIIKEEVARLLYENVDKDFTAYERDGVFAAPEFKKKLKYKNGKVTNIIDSAFLTDFENFSMQCFYMREQITKLIYGDLSHFKDMSDFEKRSMMHHSPATPVFYDKADSKQNVIYLSDIEEDSVYSEDFSEMLDSLADEGRISREQAQEFKGGYSGIKATDGQGFRTLSSWRKIRKGLGKWSDSQEDAYQEVMKGNITKSNIDRLEIGVTKLRYAGYQEIEAVPTGTEDIEQKPQRIPVLHKYSEQVLLPWHLMKGTVMEASNAPIMALSKFAYEMERARDAGVNVKVPELFLFESGCKVGAHDKINPWSDADGNRYTSSDQIAKRLREDTIKYPYSVQTLDLKYLGEAATLDTETENTDIHITSQAEKILFGNILPGDTVKIQGRGTIDAAEGRRLYDEISAATVVDAWQELCDEIGNYTAARRILLKEMGKMPYVSEETKLALTKVRNLGRNTLPLFSPQVQHEAQAIILSIIKNRMQKHKAPGARFVQKTSFGWDFGSVDYSDGLNKDNKLKIEFEGTGKDKRIKYVEAYVPITDSRLEAFADRNGEITPDRLNRLVKDKILPEEMLYCVGYRTPSDAEHSIIPIKIKGFLSSASGRTIILPREVMVMTGHDYDGDEMPVHFMHFKSTLDVNKVREKFDRILSDPEAMLYEFGPAVRHFAAEGDIEKAFEIYKRRTTLSPQTVDLYKFETEQYDYSKRPIEQSEDAETRTHILDNEKLRLMFGQVSSPSYTRRMLIPGGCEETKRIIKTIQLLKLAKTDEVLRKNICDKLDVPYTKDVGTLFEYIRGIGYASGRRVKALGSKDIDAFINSSRVPESPFSARHAMDSFGYMIESANMIGIFAMYMSSFQMLQKVDVRYIPYKSKNKKGELEDRPVAFFGKEFNNARLFEVKDITGKNMLSRVMSRLINAAVDNGKDPILGLANICPDIAPLMVTMCGLGMTEDQMDLVVSQPAIVAALKKVSVEHISFPKAIEAVLNDMSEAIKSSNNAKQMESFDLISYNKAADDVKNMTESDFANESVKTLEDMMYPEPDGYGMRIPDYDGLETQKKILFQVRQLNGAAEDLEMFVKSVLRPESASGGVSSTIGNTQGRIVAAEDCIRRIESDDFRIGGLKDIIKKIDYYDCMTSEELLDEVGDSPIPQYSLMRILEVEGSMDFMKRWFPQARKSWQDVAKRIAKMYDLSRIPEKLLDKIYKDMILWKLLGHGSYSSGSDASEREYNFKKLQDHFLSEVPAQLNDLQNRILENAKLRKEKQEAIAELESLTDEKSVSKEKLELLKQKAALKTDWQLDYLENNSFLMKLKVYHEVTSKLKPRIQYQSGGIDMTKMSDTVRRDWAFMISETFDEDIRNLASDLVDYGLFVNGFGFGKYEFGHFASMMLMHSANDGRMIKAMQDIVDSDFSDDADVDNFICQYIQNHWKDKNLLKKLEVKYFTGILAEQFDRKNAVVDAEDAIKEEDLVLGQFYLVTEGKDSLLMRYLGPNNEEGPFLKYEKLGTSNKYSQVTVEYDPNINAAGMKPYQIGDKSPWSQMPVDPYQLEPDYSSQPDSQDVPDEARRSDADSTRVQVTLEDKIKANLFKTSPMEEARSRMEMSTKNAEAAKQETVSQPDSRAESAGVATQQSDNMDDDYVPPTESEILAMFDAADSQPSGSPDILSALSGGKLYSITRIVTNDRGERVSVTEQVPATPSGVALARRRNAYVALNEKLRNMLERVNVGVGKLSAEEIIAYAEEELAIHGISDFETAKTLANGWVELIRLEEGEKGMEALPEEFAHVAIQMLGTEHPLVQRLFNALRNDESAMVEAFGEEYDLYRDVYSKEGGDWESKLVEEAAGKLVAKKLLYRQEIQTSRIRSIIQKIVDFFHEILRKIGKENLQKAIIDADTEASLLAKNLMSGRLLDEMNRHNISSSSKFLSTKKDISYSKDTIEKLIKIEIKHIDIYERRAGYDKTTLEKSGLYNSALTNLAGLRKTLKDHKTEDAILTYLKNTVESLQKVEMKLDKSIKDNESENFITGELNMLRDTLFSNIQALDAIREGLASGEITDSGMLQTSIDETAGIIQSFFDKYKRLSEESFEKFLASVYGPDGLDITVGKNKGKHVSIHDMATTGEEYAGINISAMIHSMADQRDYVLKAFDSLVRGAKFRARKKQDEYAQRIAAAITRLKKNTGSLDQEFLYELNENGKRTGRYITPEAASKLTAAQKEYYDEMMTIKSEVDKLIPTHRVKKLGIVCVRKRLAESIKDSSGIVGKLNAAKRNISQSMTSYAEEEYDTEKVYVDFEGNKVDMLPIKYLSKGKNASYEDMTSDVASAMMAYVGMATEYNEMHKVINILENAKFASMERNIVPKWGRRVPTETIENEDFSFSEAFTVKQSKSVINKCLADFISMHIYGHLHKNAGYITLFGKKIPVGKLVDVINTVTSYSQMAANIPQRISNVTTGFAQIAIQTAGKDYFGAKDVLWASGIYIKESGDRIAETGANESHSKLSLFNERFDIGQRYNDESKKKEYGKSRAAKICNTHMLYLGLELGEDYLASTTGLAIARNTKVLLDGKEINLYDAYDVAFRDEKNKTGAYLKLKDGVTKLDGSAFTQKDELDFSKKCAAVNFKLQGIYNTDDRAAIQQYPLGSLVIMYRKWIAPALKRRYGHADYNELTGSEEQGYHITSALFAKNIIKNIIKDGEAIGNSIAVNWDNLTEYEKSNCKKSATEFGILIGIMLCINLMDNLPPDDKDEDWSASWAFNAVMYQMLRLRNELGSQAPTPMLIQEASKILSSPMACIKVLTNATNALKLLWPGSYIGENSIISDENRIKSGRFKGHTQAYKYFWSLPILSMRKSVENAIDPEPLINYYK